MLVAASVGGTSGTALALAVGISLAFFVRLAGTAAEVSAFIREREIRCSR